MDTYWQRFAGTTYNPEHSMRLPSVKVLGRVTIALVVAIGIGVYLLRARSSDARYVTAPITQGPIVRSVVATGTVNPVTTVQVGSYVSGPILSLYADFNSPVKQGQLIAKIDPRVFAVKVAEAQAALANAKAQIEKDRADLGYKKLTFERDRELMEQGAVSRDQVDSARSAYRSEERRVGKECRSRWSADH